ncbi:uncharacterized protein CCR75_000625 [Bremia lactucae]|uniref:Uncharacterized protein n=1 Tax=Bremia lactucae TaxID=4779 RepID=A0A976FDI4_BRELC|nr:hypothetical protein CCR75_000625 [Bremia lactucae]
MHSTSEVLKATRTWDTDQRSSKFLPQSASFVCCQFMLLMRATTILQLESTGQAKISQHLGQCLQVLSSTVICNTFKLAHRNAASGLVVVTTNSIRPSSWRYGERFMASFPTSVV